MCKSETMLAAKVRSWLDEPGNSYTILANALGISEQAARNKVNGTVDFWFSEAVDAAELLGCNVSDFVRKG